MRATSTMILCLAAMAVTVTASADTGMVVYSHDFQTNVGPEWSNDNRSFTPIGSRGFLGRFGGEPVTLSLGPLPDHCRVTLSFDLYVIGDWEGSVGHDAGADLFDVNAATPGGCCPVENLLHATFANCECKFQSYPDTYPDVHRAGLTGADEIDTLGYERDSVYQLEFSFFHDRDELLLSFAGSPNLEHLADESWGLDNVVVRVDSSSCCRASRRLPSVFAAGEPVLVEIDVTPDPRAETYTIEEDPPIDFNAYNINDGGSFDGETVKWGPFFDDTPRTLSYTVRIANWVSSAVSFDGTISVDGDTEAICGDSSIAPGDSHPADLDGDFLLEADELTAYGAAWRNGDPWPVEPSPIPAEYVTNAGVLWRSGEGYVFDGTAAPPWVPTGGLKLGGGVASADVTFEDGARQVSIEVQPDTDTIAWTVSERLPEGWAVSDLSHDGTYDAATRQMHWGPFFDDAARTLEYRLDRVDQSAGTAALDGLASFDGVGIPVAGARVLWSGESAPVPATSD